MTADILGSLVVKDENKVANKGVVYLKTILLDGNFYDINTPILKATDIDSTVKSEYFCSRGDQVYFFHDLYDILQRETRSRIADFYDLRRQIECLVSRNHYPPYSRFKIAYFDDIYGNFHYIVYQERLDRYPYSIDEKTNYNNMDDLRGDGKIYCLISSELVTSEEPYVEEAIVPTLGYVLNSDEKLKKVSQKRVKSITEEELMNATSCFTASSRYGIKIVGGYRDQRYYTDFPRAVAKALEHHLKY